MSPRSLVRTKADGKKEGSLTNAEFSAALFYVVRKEFLADRDSKKVQSIKKFLENNRKYVKLREAVEAGTLQLTDRWKEAEACMGLVETKNKQQEQQREDEQQCEDKQEQQCEDEQEQPEQKRPPAISIQGSILKAGPSTPTTMKRTPDEVDMIVKEVKKAKLSEEVSIVSLKEHKMDEEDDVEEKEENKQGAAEVSQDDRGPVHPLDRLVLKLRRLKKFVLRQRRKLLMIRLPLTRSPKKKPSQKKLLKKKPRPKSLPDSKLSVSKMKG